MTVFQQTVNRGFAYFKMNEFEKAVSDYNTAINSTHESPEDLSLAYYNRGLAHYHLEQYESSLKDYEIAVNLNVDKESYEDFLQYIPIKNSSDVTNVRDKIFQLFNDALSRENVT